MLTDLPVPALLPEQLSLFTRDALLTRPAGSFSLPVVRQALTAEEGTDVWAVDIGGTALKYAPGTVRGGRADFDRAQLSVTDIVNGGENYLDELRSLSSRTAGARVGISTAGVVSADGTIDNPNTDTFAAALKAAGGFPALFDGTFQVVNDAVAGLTAGMLGVAGAGNTFTSAICVINGGGIGGAVMTGDGSVFASEPGQIPLAGIFNPLHVPGRRNVNGKTYPCVEQVGAMRHGVEPQWETMTGTRQPADVIAGMMENGDERAISLMDRAALITAHVIEGIRAAFGLPWDDTAVILHGGAFRTPAFVSRVDQILHGSSDGAAARLFSAYVLGYDDACLTGAAVMAIV